MTFILPIATAVICAVSFLLMLRDVSDHKEEYHIEKNSENAKLLNTPAICYCIVMFLVTVAASFLFCTLYKDNGIFMSMKRMALLSLLWPIAWIDYKTYRIPNLFVLSGICCRVILLALEVTLDDQFVWGTLLSEGIAAAALLLAAGLCALCMKNSVGFGDMKLLAVMGLMLGMSGIWGAVFLSLIVSFFISAYLLITKKKTRKDAIPFGPALVIGTYLSVCLTGM